MLNSFASQISHATTRSARFIKDHAPPLLKGFALTLGLGSAFILVRSALTKATTETNNASGTTEKSPKVGATTNGGTTSTDAIITFSPTQIGNTTLSSTNSGTNPCIGSIGIPLHTPTLIDLVFNPDGNRNPISFSATNLPSNVTIDPATGEIYGTPNNASNIGLNNIHILVSNLGGNDTSIYQLELQKSLFVSGLPSTITYFQDTPFRFPAFSIATPSENATAALVPSISGAARFEVSTSSSNATATIDPTTGGLFESGMRDGVNSLSTGLTVKPTLCSVSNFTYTFYGTDLFGQPESATISMIGVPVDHPPIVQNPLATQAGCCTGGVGILGTFPIASDTFGDLLHAGLTDRISTTAPGLTFDSATQTFSWPDNLAAGTYVVTLTKINACGIETSDSYSRTISPTLTISFPPRLICTGDQICKFTPPPSISTPRSPASVSATLNNPAAGILFTGISNNGTASFFNGTWMASGSPDDINRYLSDFAYAPPLYFDGNLTITISGSDGLNPDVEQRTEITITHVNHAPRFIQPLSSMCIPANQTTQQLTGNELRMRQKITDPHLISDRSKRHIAPTPASSSSRSEIPVGTHFGVSSQSRSIVRATIKSRSANTGADTARHAKRVILPIAGLIASAGMWGYAKHLERKRSAETQNRPSAKSGPNMPRITK